MNQFLQYFGLVCLILIVVFIILRLIFGKKWQRKVAWVILVGPGLMGASKKLADELPNKVKKETLAEVATYAFMRLTRIGLIGLTIALIPIALLWIQNNKITEQNHLIESQRRSSLVLLMNNVLTDLSAEIEEQREDLDSTALITKDSIGYSLSAPLIGRIASLSQGLLPYRFLVEGKLTEKEYSIERGQLLLALVNSNLDTTSLSLIWKTSNFSGSYLRNAPLYGAFLRMAELSGAEFSGAVLFEANLRGARLRGADFIETDLNLADLSYTNLQEANLFRTELYEANLYSSRLDGADLSNSYLFDANLTKADFSEADIRGIYDDGVDYSKARNLFRITGLDPILKQQLEKDKPCLFTKRGCR